VIRILKLLESSGLVLTRPLTKQSFDEFKGTIDADENLTKKPAKITVDKSNEDDEDGALTVSFSSTSCQFLSDNLIQRYARRR
jgi:hypothetical protein